jgi:hypothetical protein
MTTEHPMLTSTAETLQRNVSHNQTICQSDCATQAAVAYGDG